MKKISFKVSSQKEDSVISLIKEVNKISCRICLDVENGYVVVENVIDTMIDSVIELVNNCYTILGVDIDNTFEEATENLGASVVTESTADTTDNAAEKTVKEVSKETSEVVTEKQPTVLEPQSEDDLIIKRVEFENEYVENQINKLLKTAYWAMYSKRATEKDISDYLLTCAAEISMRYSSDPVIKFSIGDIVDVNYGTHLPGEIIGGHVHAIVCNILNNMVFVLPIAKSKMDIKSQDSLLINVPQDATYEDESYNGGTVLLNKGKYVRPERFYCIKGKTKPEFFEKLLHQLASTFDFTGCLTTAVEDDNNLPLTMEETTVTADDTSDAVVQTPTVTDDTSNKASQSKSPSIKVRGEESALLEVIGFAFDKLDPSKTVNEQVESFLTDIGMTTTERMVTQSFIIACDINKINYENLLLRLHELFPKVTVDIIKNILKEEFKNWLKKYPTLTEKYPKISLMAVLKVFAKKFA